ncbi:MAG: hypothetical protein BGO76_00105 [Caedibacter sp. 38-128]|nr:MAG: hypothetical protein BGO76_00105 [Caedibacter sp. 38-128]
MQFYNFQLFTQYPSGFTPLFITQVLFNFGFYGFKALFLLYAIDSLALKEQEAITFFSAFMSLSYATSLIGGTLADKITGSRNTLLIGGGFCCIAVLLLIILPKTSVYVAMSLLSVGLGCYKPNFSTMLSRLFENNQDPLKDSAFTTLYIAMNIGSFLGPLVSSFISVTYGWQFGLMIILISFISGTLLFFKRSQLPMSFIKKTKNLAILKSLFILILIACLIYYLFKYKVYFHGLMGIIVSLSIALFIILFFKATPLERKNLLKAIYYIILFALFCALYEQCGSSLLLFFERFIDRQIFNLTIPPSSLLSINPILVLMLGIIIPFVTNKFFLKNIELEGFTKFSIGFFLTSLSFGLLCLAAFQGHIPISILWMLSAILFQTIGEFFIVPVGFSNISKLVPQKYIGFMMGLWLMAISYGHYLAGLMANYLLNTNDGKFVNTLESFSQFFMKLSILPLIVSIFLIFLTFKRKPMIDNN